MENQCIARKEDLLSGINQTATKIDIVISVKITLIEPPSSDRTARRKLILPPVK
jgi:hypothetical protein